MQRREFIKKTSIGTLAIAVPYPIKFQDNYSKEDLMGKSNIELHGLGYQLQKEAHQAFLKLKEAAATEGFLIKVVSSYRNYNHQNRIWERKYKKFTQNENLSPTKAIQKIIEYSTIPGTSRHHWGTDVDIVDGNAKQPKGLLLEKNFHGDGPFCRFKEWMDINSEQFGFYLVYTNRKDRKGFKYEPWHYSYAPISIPMLKAYQKLNVKTELLKANLLGSSYFTDQFVQSYIEQNILDINPKLI